MYKHATIKWTTIDKSIRQDDKTLTKLKITLFFLVYYKNILNIPEYVPLFAFL